MIGTHPGSVIARVVIACGVLLSTAAAQQPASKPAPASRPDAAALCAQLRAGDWSPEAFQALITQLTAEKAWFAADGWMKAADDAVAAKKLPAGARSPVSSVRSKLAAESHATPEARAIWAATDKHVRDLMARKAPHEAELALFTLEALAAVWSEPEWTRSVAGLWKQIKTAKDASGETGPDGADRGTTAELEVRLVKDLTRRAARALDEFVRYGCAQAYVRAEALQKAVGRRAVFSPGLKSLHAAARGFGLARDVVAHVMGETRILVRQDDAVVALDGAGKNGSVDARTFRDIRLKALPGEFIVFELDLPPDADSPSTAGGGHAPFTEVFVHASYRGNDLPKYHWQVLAKNDFSAPDPAIGPTLFAAIGENRGVSIDGKFPICMNYAVAGEQPGDHAIVLHADDSPDVMGKKIMDSLFADLLSLKNIQYTDTHKALEAKVTGPRAAFAWTVGDRERPAYLLLIPKDDAPTK